MTASASRAEGQLPVHRLGLQLAASRGTLRWIEGAKKPETRDRRVKRTVEQLSEGKRRACCVNVYEYMMERVQEDEQKA